MKTLMILVILAGIAAAGDPITSELEELSGNWYKVGFTCGQADILNRTGGPLPQAKAFCANWDAKFHRRDK